MKATERSLRRRRSQTGPGISLFPFLAVLICTMGALVPLLLAITRTARQQAETEAMAKAGQQGEKVKTEREEARWRIEQLAKSRVRVEKQLSDARLELGHIEDHSRRLRGQLEQYQRTIADLQAAKNADGERVGRSQAELEQVRKEIATAQQQLAEANKAASGRKGCYAIVPYEGPNQTHRRPVYLECRADAVVLQPEGIELTEADFEGPLGPGNPLAATLRAAREYLLSSRQFDPQVGDPYPMLLVRPEGIAAYYAARAAMKSWGFDFGYELVDDDWKLAYPPPDPRLAETVRQVVASARVSQARLAAAAPRHYGGGTKTTYRAAPGGGFIRETVPAGKEDRGYASATPSEAVGADAGYGGGNGGGYGGSVAGSGSSGYGGSGAGSGGSAASGSAVGSGDGYGGTSTGAGGSSGYGGGGYGGNGYGSGGPELTAAGGGTAGDGSQGAATGSLMAAGNAGTAGGSQQQGSGSAMPSSGAPHPNPLPTNLRSVPGEGTGGERPEGYVVGQPQREHAASSRPAPSDSPSRGRVLLPGEWQPAPERPAKQRDDKDDKSHAGRRKSLAEDRGVDWAMRDAARGSVGVTRPIRVDCYGDRLIIVSERGQTASKMIPLGPRTETSVDLLTSAVWEHIESWGMAGRGMYWRPLLQVYVAPDAEPRFAELAALLDGSGIIIERK